MSHPTSRFTGSSQVPSSTTNRSANQNPSDAGEGRLLYTEETTKTTTYDAEGNILDTNIQRQPRHNVDPSTYEASTFTTTGAGSGLSSGIRTGTQTQGFMGGTGDTSYTNYGRMSDEYGRTGGSHIGNETQRTTAAYQREGSGARGPTTAADKIVGQSEKVTGKMTSDPNLYNRGAERAAGNFQSGRNL